MKDLLLITPPFTQLNTPYPATAYIKGYLNTIGKKSFQSDLGIKVILRIFSKEGLTKVFQSIENKGVKRKYVENVENETEMKILQKTAVSCLLLSCLNLSASANEIDEAITAATKHYKAGELSQAIAQLDYASTLIRQEKGEQVKLAFPAAPAGWQAEDAEAEVAGAAMFGGGISASRNYYNDEQRIEMQLMMDSPMLQAFSMMLSNPSMIAMSGGKITKVQGIQAVQKIEDGEMELQFVTANGAMVTLTGDSSAKNTILALANAIDLKKL